MEPLLLARRGGPPSPKDLGDQCEIVIVSLPTLAAFRAAVIGPEGLAGGRALKVLLNTCTVGVPFLREVESALAPNRVTIVDRGRGQTGVTTKGLSVSALISPAP